MGDARRVRITQTAKGLHGIKLASAPTLDMAELVAWKETVVKKLNTGVAALLKRALRDGFVLGDHTWTHADVSGDGPAARSQIEKTKNAIQRETGYTPCLFRAPGGAVSAPLISEARGMGFNTIQWDVDPNDWRTPGTDAIYSRVTSNRTAELPTLLPSLLHSALLPFVGHEIAEAEYQRVTRTAAERVVPAP